MKISFREGNTPQKAVSPAQTEMRNSKAKKVPAFKVFIFLILVGIVSFLVYRILNGDTVYTYGLVKSNIAEYNASDSGVISKIYVKRGDNITKGQLLFEIKRSQVEEKLIELNHKKTRLELDLKNITERFAPEQYQTAKNKFETKSNALKEFEHNLGLLESELKNLEEKQTFALKTSSLEITKLKEIYDSKVQRYNKLADMLKMDAVVEDSVQSAEAEMKLAEKNLEQAKLAHESTKTKTGNDIEIHKQKINNEKNRLETTTKEIAELQTTMTTLLKQNAATQNLEKEKIESELQSVKQAIENITKPIEFKSTISGQVLEVMRHEDDNIGRGEVIISVVDSSTLWVDVYVRASNAANLTTVKKVNIYPLGSDTKILGTLASTPSKEVTLPAVLKSKFPGMSSGIYVKVNIDNNSNVLPGNIVKVIMSSK